MNTGNANFDKFLSRTPEEMMAAAEASRLTSEAFNRGQPIPAVAAADIKQLRDVTRRLHADHPPREDTAVGLSIFVEYGLTFADEPVRLLAAQTRLMLLTSLLERGVLNRYLCGEEPDDRAFHAAATLPITKEDLAQTMLPQFLSKAPPDVAEKARAEWLAGGFDPSRPGIDGKFLHWLQEKC